MEILASDSMGARSMATFVRAGGHAFLIDPGVALGPKRFGLPPHPLELARRDELWRRVREKASEAEFIILTHYHHDHYNPQGLEVFCGKTVFLKDWERNINKSQRKRASELLSAVSGAAKEIFKADGESFRMGDVTITFSPAQPHGYTNRLGYVVQVLIEEGGRRFLFTSDIQGACLREHLDFMLDSRAHVIFMDGVPIYLAGSKFSWRAVESSKEHLAELLGALEGTTLVLDHHLTRDARYGKWLSFLGGALSRVLTAAEFMGRTNLLLEANRKRLYHEGGLQAHQI